MEVDGLFFQAPDAHLTPLGDHHFLDQEVFDGSGGLEFLDKGPVDFIEAVAGFVLGDDAAGEQGLTPVGVGGIEPSDGRDRTARPGAVDAGRFDLFFGSHYAWMLLQGGRGLWGGWGYVAFFQ